MARFKVTHSQDACRIDIEGDKRNPEPTMACIGFPGGDVEVSRTSDGRYWIHFRVADPANIDGSRMDFVDEEYKRRRDAGQKTVIDIPGIEGKHIPETEGKVLHMAFLVKGRILDQTGD